MAISTKLGFKQTSKLALTQHLIQSIKLLQLSNIELAEKISTELLDNPVLEEDKITQSITSDENGKDEDLISGVIKELSGDESIFKRREEKDLIYENFSDNIYSRIAEDDKKQRFIENAITQDETLKEHLISQAHLIAKDENELTLLEIIITSVDDNGFLNMNNEEIAKENNISEDQVQKILFIINGLDPIGCGTKNIQESLVVQAEQLHPEDKVLLMILKDHFLDLEKMQYNKIAKDLHITNADVIQKSRLVHNLAPYPGVKYSIKETKYIIPDINVKLIDNEIFVNLNDDWIPTIRINSYYSNILKKKSIDKNVVIYLKEKMQSANYLLKSISSRRETIVKVVTAIMEYQREFFSRGIGSLKPLVYSDIARETGLHESTISRVSTNKYVQTSWGVFELKYFFVSKLKSHNEKDHSSDEVINLIKNIISDENPKSPVTDEDILQKLKEKNINIARRTVSKYRGALNIPSSNMRKKINTINNQ